MAAIPTTDVVRNVNLGSEIGLQGLATVTYGGHIKFPKHVANGTSVITSGDYIAIEAQYTNRFQPPA